MPARTWHGSFHALLFLAPATLAPAAWSQDADAGAPLPFALIAIAALAALALYLALKLRRERQAWKAEREALADREAQARDAIDSNQAKNNFLEHLGTAFRTPLNVILGFAQLQKSQLTPDASPETVRRTEATLTAGWRLLELLDDIVDITRLEQQSLHLNEEDCALDDVISHAASLVGDEALVAGVSVDAEPSGLAVHADYTRLKQIFVSLLRNAVLYNRAGGSVRISAERGRDGMVTCRVADTGLGIAVADRDRVFEPFTRTSTGQEVNPEGAGIGLPLARFLSEFMGGSLDFESVEGEGTTFTLVLKGSDAEAGEVSAATAEATQTPPSKPISVVYVEDHRASLDLMMAILEPLENVELLTATNAEAGLELIAAHRPDLVLLDINLAGMDGITAARELKANPELQHIPLVALSADATEGQIQEALDAGFSRYLAKPLDIDQLWRILGDISRNA